MTQFARLPSPVLVAHVGSVRSASFPPLVTDVKRRLRSVTHIQVYYLDHGALTSQTHGFAHLIQGVSVT